MIVVSDASPLINLACIHRLNLLRTLYGEVVIPQAVWAEVVVEGEGQPGADEVRIAEWIKTHPVENRTLVRALRQELDAGEAEAISLGLEEDADLLLMDDRVGRETAQHLGLRTVGLIGVLIVAKRHGHISAIKPLLDALREQAGFRVSDILYARVLKDEGEDQQPH